MRVIFQIVTLSQKLLLKLCNNLAFFYGILPLHCTGEEAGKSRDFTRFYIFLPAAGVRNQGLGPSKGQRRGKGVEKMEKGEKTLVKRAMRGNPKAFGTLVEREQEYLYRMAFLYVRQEQDALDVVQESILKAYKSLKTLREPEYFRTWLTKIVINTAQDTLRARQRTAPLEEELD